MTPVATLAAAIAAVCALAAPARALIVMYDDKAAFDAAARTLVLTDFEGLVGDREHLLPLDEPLVVDGFRYGPRLNAMVCGALRCDGQPFDSAVLTKASISDGPSSDPNYAYGGLAIELWSGSLGQPVTAFGGTFGHLVTGPTAGVIQVFTGDGGQTLYDVVVSGMGAGVPKTFFGFTVDEGESLVRVSLVIPFSLPAMDDLQIGVVKTPAPAPAALLAAGIAALGLGGLRRRRAG
ncbi:hypothetical protein P2H44_04160 [Albimonas sp. CAU 1670]|uniref:hypothetical protein n=1 Tax=Albimonas sp. CAU 1670 TaxID=3032599 RepID=UPI0023DADAC9|nr:hypothetical protein [Albimonas sp. CAU 1670]MDF2231737.1 hypothetical protein [Albimonas sp. CAU 1670]